MGSLTRGEKKFGLVAGVVLLVTAAIVVTSVWLLTRDGDEESPYIQATTGSDLVRVEPTIYCGIDLSDCRQGTPGTFAQRLSVPVGRSVLVSVGKEIATAPWVLTLEYLTPRGFEQRSQLFTPDQKYSFSARSTPDAMLSTIEVRLPSSRIDESGAPITRAFWSVNTLPPGTRVPQR
ncbi:DUF2771 family protein [Williamsia deligens]|uniref:DUF2771 family protein n=1 Tax=Williamsia deligens TaxID=321325 RepID=A0ABW3G9S1_9NOCA|nr:DUF2771 family protein [Williamsia deligens]MCP2192836.1 Protein of unknown function (DUF2771) [Williamsia deligens]